MKKSFDTVKGTFEYLPNKQILREKIKGILQDTFVRYGFAPVETPILSSYELLASKYSDGADILNEMYTLSDRGHRELGLRYDLTIGFCKMITSNANVTLPFKRYEIGKVFRDGPVRVGRNREFTQCDVDMVGVKSIMAEAEYLTMAAEAYSKLGLDIIIKVNNRKLLLGIIECVCGDISEEKSRKVILLIDKFAKLNSDELRKQFLEIGVVEKEYETLRDLLGSDLELLQKKLQEYNSNSFVSEGFAEISELYNLMKGTEAYKFLQFAPYLARGIDIYTGTVWEVFLKEGVIQTSRETIDFTNTSVGGGGRYDKIITSFIDDGNDYPAIGMTFGLDVIYEVITRLDGGRKKSVVDLYIIPMGTEVESFSFATHLRQRGCNVEIEKNKRKVGKLMEYANKMGIPFTCVIGSNEIEEGRVNIKNMQNGKSKPFAITDYEEISLFVRNNKN